MPDFLNVDHILNELDLKEDMVGVELGCGSALFAIALAKKMLKGRVYALDILKEKLSALKGKLAIEKIHNVYGIYCNLEADKGSTLRSEFVDIVLMPNILFQSKNKHAIIIEAKRVTKSGGQILIIDWMKVGSFGPKENLVSSEEVKKMAQPLGLIFKKEFALGDYHYALLFIKGQEAVH